MSLFTAACFCRHPFSRSYGAILPSSLTMLLPSALGFSPHPPVSVYGTGTLYTIAAFLGTQLACFATWISLRVYLLDCKAGLLTLLLLVLHRSLLSRLMLSACVPTFLIQRSTGISTCCPSATPFGLVLGPDLPRADQLYPGNLGYSAGRILTFLSLLIPAGRKDSHLPLATHSGILSSHKSTALFSTASSLCQCSSTAHTYV